MGSNRGSPILNVLHQVVVVLVQAVQNMLRELRGAEGLTDRGQRVGDRLDLVEVVVRRGVPFLAVTKLTT